VTVTSDSTEILENIPDINMSDISLATILHDSHDPPNTATHIDDENNVIFSNDYLSITLSKDQPETEITETEPLFPVQVKRANSMPVTYRSTQVL
jgi:hypothetical protein